MSWRNGSECSARDRLFSDSTSIFLALRLASERRFIAAWNFVFSSRLPKLTPASGSSANDTCSCFQGLAFLALKLDFLSTVVLAVSEMRRAGSGGLADLSCAARTAVVLAVSEMRRAGSGGLADLSCAARTAVVLAVSEMRRAGSGGLADLSCAAQTASCGLPLATEALAAGVA